MTSSTEVQPDRDMRMSARAYVTSRFFPPLPVEYGDLAVDALQVLAEYGPEAKVALPANLNPLPHGYWEEDEALFVRAHVLISALRLEHMLPDGYDED